MIREVCNSTTITISYIMQLLNVYLSLKSIIGQELDLSKFLKVLTALVKVVENCGLYFGGMIHSLLNSVEFHKQENTLQLSPTQRNLSIKLDSSMIKIK